MKQRSSPRTCVILPLQVITQRGDAHAGVVRDVSKEAIFFFGHFEPELHSKINFTVELTGAPVSCTGQVIRVERFAPGRVVGVAVRILSCSLTEAMIQLSEPDLLFPPRASAMSEA